MFNEHIVFDESAIEELQALQVEGEPSFVGGLIQDYLSQLDSILESIFRHQAASEIKRLEESSHKLKSSSGALGLPRLAAICGAIEKKARSGTLAPSEVDALKIAAPEAKTALSNYLLKL